MFATASVTSFFEGLRVSMPFLLVAGPFGLLFGVVGTEAGLNIAEVMGFTIFVVAGAAQLTALQLLADNAPVVIVLLSSLAVNLRMAMYSASLAPHLGAAPLWQRALAAYWMFDPNYAVAMARYETGPKMPLAERVAFYFGSSMAIAPLWYAMTFVGALIGRTVPQGLALDFVLPINFLALIGPVLRTPAHVAAALVATLLGLLTAGIPYNLGLLVAAAAAIATGAEVERRMNRRTVA
ncbi:AzlC family ABC transporter permease [Tropicimonas sp. IMCC6043]|uniref:AzlC family ABC transporter permease n=1 Tax=Tropicimonas sp. IMCC6043 TaxID=2510645 RepID=UPI00101CE276|nr:AzlC family ABC transporter permease [Tropicimonas sp. IMCC6043]RYH10572.1 branched-chain amino acid ABC transporter permease [Tropicimonas sp. IMCC6043]